MDISELGLKHLAGFEGFVPRLYDDPAGHATIGYGFLIHLGPYHRRAGVDPRCDRWRRGISQADAMDLLRKKVRSYGAAVLRATTVALTQHQYDALTSFCYNVGAGGYESSAVRTAVNAGRDPCPALRRVIYGVGSRTPLAGLVRRREEECALYHLPDIESEEEDMAAIIKVRRGTKTYFVRGGKPKHIPTRQVRVELAAAFGLNANPIAVSRATFDFLNR